MNRTTYRRRAGLALLALPFAASAGPNVHAGLWEITTKTAMHATNVQLPAMPPETKTQCITQQDVAAPQNIIPAQSGCTVSDVGASGDTVRWQMACGGELPTQGSGETHYSGDTFSGTATVTSAANGFRFDLTLAYSGRRIGDCK